jgi:hypothetical protein
MKIFTHMMEQPFVLATGLAALIHSTWSLGTLFAGTEPTPQFTLQWFGWLIPALLIAFALDVGQIATSADIRTNGLTLARGVTFGVFSLATWYLQWLYIAHHMPALDLAPGIGDAHRAAAEVLRDMAMWFIPALLPLSTMLYTISGHREQTAATQDPTEHLQLAMSGQPVQVDKLPLKLPILADQTDDREPVEVEELPHIASCSFCAWSGSYSSEIGAQRAKRAHERSCPERITANGHVK